MDVQSFTYGLILQIYCSQWLSDLNFSTPVKRATLCDGRQGVPFVWPFYGFYSVRTGNTNVA